MIRMTPKERLEARLAGKPVDKIPNMNIFMSIIAREAGVSYREYVLDYRHLVKGNLVCAEKYGLDSVGVISESRETAAYGSCVIYPEDASPYADPLLIGDDHDLSKLIRFDPLENERTLDRVKGCELLHEKAGADYPVIGWIEGCLAQAAELRGVSELMMDLAEDEPYLEDLLPLLHEQQKRFAKAQIDAGADIMGVGNAVSSLVGPRLYGQYGVFWDKAITEYIHGLGAKVKLHICGNITAILPLIKDVQADILDIDWMVDFGAAAKFLEGSKTAANGNINPVSFMQCGPGELERLVKRCIEAGTATTLISGGCEIPSAAPDENLLLMDRLLYRQ